VIVALAFAFVMVEIIINIIDSWAARWHTIAVAVVLVPCISSGAIDWRALALTVLRAPVEVVRAVLGAADACAEFFIPDFVDSTLIG